MVTFEWKLISCKAIRDKVINYTCTQQYDKAADITISEGITHLREIYSQLDYLHNFTFNKKTNLLQSNIHAFELSLPDKLFPQIFLIIYSH